MSLTPTAQLGITVHVCGREHTEKQNREVAEVSFGGARVGGGVSWLRKYLVMFACMQVTGCSASAL